VFIPLHIAMMLRIVLSDAGAAKRLGAMLKFMIVFSQPEDAERFENVYQDFLALVERMPNILRRQVVHVTGSPQGTPEIYRILELYFESTETQNEALLSIAGQEAGKELQRLATGSYQLLHADVYEEDGASTPRAAAEEEPVTPEENADAAAGDSAEAVKTITNPVARSSED